MPSTMSERATKNPCIKVCKFDADGVCRGCFRTTEEARSWKRLSDDEKAAVNRRVLPRIAACGKGGGKRLRKLDRKIAKLEKRLLDLRAKRLAALGAA